MAEASPSLLVAYAPYLPFILYLLVEVFFGVVFFQYMIPRANRLTKPIPYRDYGDDKLKLMLRIMHRIEEVCSRTHADKNETMKAFLTEWFHADKPTTTKSTTTTTRGRTSQKQNKISDAPNIVHSPSSSPENSDDEGGESHVGMESAAVVSCKSETQLYRQELDRFFAWAFYGKFYSDLEAKDLQELDRIYNELKDRHGLVFPYRTAESSCHDKHHGQPRCMTLEQVNAMYRPLMVYLIVYAIKISGGIVLRMNGFRRILSSNGLVSWHRPGRESTSTNESVPSSPLSSFLPILFFHGIAPGGVTLYLPMLLFGLATEPERPVFLFENRSISCAIDFHPLTEQQTVDGVVEILERYNMDQNDLSLVGHSFGSCPITWILASKRLPNVKQVALIDPVAILLSEPDVMVNFLYAEEMDKIRMVASSELFTEYYLRRHFAWYNSELWLEDVDCPILIGLSEKDEIINYRKVRQELERHDKNVTLVHWNGVGHGACIYSPAKWRQFKQLMLEQELHILRTDR